MATEIVRLGLRELLNGCYVAKTGPHWGWLCKDCGVGGLVDHLAAAKTRAREHECEDGTA